MKANYVEMVNETIKNNPSINKMVVEDVTRRVADWLESPYATASDDYLRRQYEYLINFI